MRSGMSGWDPLVEEDEGDIYHKAWKNCSTVFLSISSASRMVPMSIMCREVENIYALW